MRKFITVLGLVSFTTTVVSAADLTTVTPFTITLATAANKYPNMDIQKEVLRYNRCYAHLARKVVPATDSRMPLIKTKAINGTEACLHLLESARLDNSGKVKMDGGIYNPESRAVLKTMHDFHRSWFQAFDFKTAIPRGDDNANLDYSLLDAGEMALHLTNTLFNSNVPFSSIVTNEASFEAIRDDRNNGTIGVRGKNTTSVISSRDMNGAMSTFVPKYLSTGEIIGVKALEPDPFPGAGPINYKASMGGGIIGTFPYLLLNGGQQFDSRVNGGMVQYRRWSKAVYADLFCRNIPVVRSIDAIVKVQTNSNLAFRKGISCMQCHASIDPLGQVHRNHIIKTSNPNSFDLGASYIHPQPVSLASETAEAVEDDGNFYKRPPKGKFFFRSYNGKLHDYEANGVQEMGDYMANVDDLYVCAAKRYYQFLTGIDIPLYDVGDMTSPALSAKQNNYRNIIVNLGLELKRTQNVEVIISKIIASEAYINPGSGE